MDFELYITLHFASGIHTDFELFSQTQTITPNNITQLTFVKEKRLFFFKSETEFVNISLMNFPLEKLNSALLKIKTRKRDKK
jgi:hypothetical protein